MKDHASLHVLRTPFPAPAHDYLVYGAVHDISGRADMLDQGLLEKLVRRRLNRLQRVLSVRGGALVRELRHGLIAAFESAEAAVFCACEMQRYCAAIPQIADARIALRIGIHPRAITRIAADSCDPAEATSEKLSSLLGEASVVLSGPVIESLPDMLREAMLPLDNDGSGIAAYALDWNNLTIPQVALPHVDEVRAARRAGQSEIVLRHGGQQRRFGVGHPVITIGRDPANDIALNNPQASRHHCRIIYGFGSYVLVDTSTNGTFVIAADGSENVARKDMLTLSGHGKLCFGHDRRTNAGPAFEFEIFASES